MSATLFCNKCGSILVDQFVVTKTGGFTTRSKALMYCINRSCAHFGLITYYGSVTPKNPKKES